MPTLLNPCSTRPTACCCVPGNGPTHRCSSPLSRGGEIRRWHTRRPSTERQVGEWFDAYRQDWQQERGGHWAIAGNGGEVLGRIALRGLDFDDGIAGAAYWVLPSARGIGAASQALTALSAWALDEIGFCRLELDHSTRNRASCAVAAKCGYVLEGTKRSAALHDDGRHDMHLHARVRAEYCGGDGAERDAC